MLTPNDIMTNLERLVRKKFPEEDVYTNLCPSGFQRPSTLIQLSEWESLVAYGCGIVELRPTVTLTTFVVADDYHHSHLQTIHLRQMTLLGLFLPGYIRVGDRAVKVASGNGQENRITMGGGWDFGTVPFTYTLDRGEFETIPQPPAMGELHVRQEVHTYG